MTKQLIKEREQLEKRIAEIDKELSEPEFRFGDRVLVSDNDPMCGLGSDLSLYRGIFHSYSDDKKAIFNVVKEDSHDIENWIYCIEDPSRKVMEFIEHNKSRTCPTNGDDHIFYINDTHGYGSILASNANWQYITLYAIADKFMK